MGLCSTKLICPKNYNSNKFSTIAKIYDYLDSDGNRSITSDEMINFTDVYYSYHISDLNKNIIEAHEFESEQLEFIKDDCKKKLRKMHRDFYEKNRVDILTKTQKEDMNEFEYKKMKYMDTIKNQFNRKRTKMEMEIKLIKSLNAHEKSIKLVEDMGKKRLEEIEFRHFFDFIKNRDVDVLAKVLD